MVGLLQILIQNYIQKKKIMKYQCSQCGETKNLHFNLDYSKAERPVESILCNECGLESEDIELCIVTLDEEWDMVFNDIDFRGDIPIRIRNAFKNNYLPPVKK